MATASSMPRTVTAPSTGSVWPCPSCPSVLLPQQATSPARRKAHANAVPAAKAIASPGCSVLTSEPAALVPAVRAPAWDSSAAAPLALVAGASVASGVGSPPQPVTTSTTDTKGRMNAKRMRNYPKQLVVASSARSTFATPVGRLSGASSRGGCATP